MKNSLLILSLCISSVAVVSAQTINKKILVEEFTGEGCVNCPRVAGYVHTSLEKEEFADNVIVVCHHSGYHDDWLTTDFDRDYKWFYNAPSTFAPGMMVDRNTPESATSPVYSISSPSMMEDLWRDALAEIAGVSVNISAEHDKENKLIKVRVDGVADSSLDIENPVVTVFLVEDDIEAIHQTGAGEDYIHQHVGRAVNSSWGEPVVFNGGSYVYDYEFNVDPFWMTGNMYVVACISNYNSEDPTDCKVMNTSKLPFSDFKGLSVGIASIEAEEESEAIYTLSGIKIDSKTLSPGIYIRKKGSETSKIIIR
ncbi:MAG: Omp28-related outer membrane protein [Bacteroides sp.]|nr:Omp28-related outer membrane protein [Bacteroides sp.]